MIQEILLEYIDETTEKLISYLDNTKKESKKKKGNRGMLYFAIRASTIMDKIDNLDTLKDIVLRTEFKYTPEKENEAHFSNYGTYYNKLKFCYGDKLLSINRSKTKEILMNELIYSIMKPTATASKLMMEKCVKELTNYYYALGLIYTYEDLGLVGLKRMSEEDNITAKIKLIEPNKESIKKRYKEDMEDGVIEYFIPYVDSRETKILYRTEKRGYQKILYNIYEINLNRGGKTC